MGFWWLHPHTFMKEALYQRVDCPSLVQVFIVVELIWTNLIIQGKYLSSSRVSFSTISPTWLGCIGSFSCGKCPRGWRVSNNTHSICQECDESPSMYDWFYLAFHAILVLVLHFFFIDMYAPRRSFTKDVIVCHLSAVVEVTVSSVLSVLAL